MPPKPWHQAWMDYITMEIDAEQLAEQLADAPITNIEPPETV